MAAIAFAALIVEAAPVAAMGGGDGCNPGRTATDYPSHYWDGIFEDDNVFNNRVYAADSPILVYSPWVQPEGNGGSSATSWAMIEAYNTCCTYWQAGWYEWAHGNRDDFVEYDGNNDPNAYYDEWFQPQSINTYHWYEPQWNPGNASCQWEFFEDNYAGVCYRFSANFTPTQAHFSGETHTALDQMPGGYDYPEYFWYPRISSTANAALHYGQYQANYVTASFTGIQNGSDHFDIWDRSCAN